MTMSDEFPPQPGAVDGHALSSVEQEEWRRIEQAYKEIQRRDDRAEYRAWRKEPLTWGLLLVVLVQLGVMVYQWWDRRKVQAFVQVVQVDEKSKIVQLGIPQDLLSYQPPAGVWMDMLGEWVRRVRWREEDARVHAKEQWAWVYWHTCGQARRLVQQIAEKE